METKEIVIDEAVTKAIAEQVTKAIQPQIDALKVEKELEVSKIATEVKAVEGVIVDELDTMTKEAFAVAQIKAALSGNTVELSKLNAHAIKSLKAAGLVEKATYLNAGTSADGGAVVPNAALLADIFSVLPTYSPLSSLLREITLLEGDSLDISTLTADVIMTEVGTEGGNKTVTKPVMGDGNIAVREFAGIALVTKKLLRQASIDIYAVLRDSFARAIAKNREVLILSDASSGIINKVGVVARTLTSTNTTVSKITVKDVKNLAFAVPTASAAGGTYVFSRLLLAELANREDTTGQPVVTINAGQSAGALGGTFNGYPFVVAETLGTSDAISTVHAVFGNWGQFGVVLKQGAIDSQVFDSGIVVDGSAVSHNLIQQNKLAMRVENWENVGYPLPGAFAVLKTAAA